MTNTTNTSEPLVILNANPWTNGAEDAHFTDGVVTFYSLSYILHENYKYGSFTDEDGEMLEPGVYRDSEIMRDGGENCYTVILDWNGPLCAGIVEKGIEDLNNEYGLDFHERIIVTGHLGVLEKAGIPHYLHSVDFEEVVEEYLEKVE